MTLYITIHTIQRADATGGFESITPRTFREFDGTEADALLEARAIREPTEEELELYTGGAPTVVEKPVVTESTGIEVEITKPDSGAEGDPAARRRGRPKKVVMGEEPSETVETVETVEDDI